MSAQPSIFKSPEGEAAYFAAYDAALELWPVPFQTMQVVTRLGSTHVLACGPEEKPPLVLLHMAALSSTMWYPNAAVLSAHFRIFAVDVMNDLGRSVPVKPRNSRAASAAWLLDVFDGLGIDRARVIGASNGGWVALNQAIATPDRIERLALLAPAGGIAALRLRFWISMLPALLYPEKGGARKAAQSLAANPKKAPADEALIEQLAVGFRHLRLPMMFGMAWQVVFSDTELRNMQVPLLLLVGDREVIYDPHAVIDRAQRLIPGVETELIPDAGHGPNSEQPEVVNARLLDFLLKDSDPG